MATAATYREAVAPPTEQTHKLVLRPEGWKARLWRAFDGSATIMLRLDAPISLGAIEDKLLRDLLTPYLTSLRGLDIYLERGAAVPLPMPWSVGRVSIDREHAVIWLHRFLEDPFGSVLATLFRAGDARADVTLAIVPYEIEREHILFAVRDYDIGAGADFARGS